MDEKNEQTRKPIIPDPILDAREYDELDNLVKRFEKLSAPGPVVSTAKKATAIVPAGLKDKVVQATDAISEQEIYAHALRLMGDGFKVIEEQVARFTVSEATVIKGINAVSKAADIESLDEVCRVRSYDVAKAASKRTLQQVALAVAEGGGTGAAGFAGIPFNLVLSTFIFYRAVQSVAMAYGYDVKNDPAELVIASEVFANALSPTTKGGDEVSNNVAKVMTISTAQGVKQASKKSWAAMIEKGGVARLLTQMRGLASGAARKALENAGQKGLENSIFREVFEQVGRRATLKNIGRAVPFFSAGIGALIDTKQMSVVLEYADIFYHKRFILEKEHRVKLLYGLKDDPLPEQEVDATELDQDMGEEQPVEETVDTAIDGDGSEEAE